MKLETTARILRDALSIAARVVDKQGNIPVLGMVCFRDGRVIGTDLDMEVSVNLQASRFEGAALLPQKALGRLVSRIPLDETVRIDAGSSGATISFSSGRYELPVRALSDFPDFAMPDQKPIEIDGVRLKKAVAFVRPFAFRDWRRPYLCGVHISDDAAVSTDGHRLGWHALGFDGSVFGGAILPNPLVAILSSARTPRSATLGAGRVAFEMDGFSIRSKLADGTYPDYRRVIPERADSVSHMIIDRAEFLKKMARVAAVAPSAERRGVTLAWDGVHLAAVGKSYLLDTVACETMAVLPGSSSVKGLTAYDVDYLTDVLRSIHSKAVMMFYVAAEGPSLWRGDDDSFVALMPIRLADEKLALNLLASQRLGEAAP